MSGTCGLPSASCVRFATSSCAPAMQSSPIALAIDFASFAAVAIATWSISSTGSAPVTRILGVDPGIHGGLAIVEILDGATPVLLDAADIPTIGIKAKERVDAAALCAFIVKHAPQHAFVERAQAMPRQGASSGFKYGRAVGSIESVITCCDVPLTIVEPSVWKRAHGLRGSEKEASRQRALQVFPSAHALLARRKDHGRAEAALIALSRNVT
jgi:crossover junction endodeoxyribonuclease RuvC